VLSWQGAIIDQSLMLLHTGVQWDVVILAPATKWVKQQDWVLVTSLHELLTGILKQKDVTIVQWVSDLEAVHGISTTLLHLLVDLSWGQSVLIKAIVVGDALEESGGFTGDKPVTLLHDGFSLGVLAGEATEGTGANLLLTVGEEAWLVDNSDDLIVELKSDSWLVLQLFLLFGSHVLGDWHRQQVSLAGLVGHGLAVHGLEELHLVHEAGKWVSPSL